MAEMGGPPPRPSAGGGTGLSGRMLGLPLWGWLALATAGGIAFFAWRRGSGSKTDQTQNTPIQVVPDNDQNMDEAILAQIRNLQGAPSTPVPTPTPTPTASGGAPGPVTGLRIVGVGQDFISAAWDPTPGATSYDVMEKSPYGGTPHSTPLPAIVIPGLAAPDTNHQLTVSAKNANGNGPATTITAHTSGRFIGPRPKPINSIPIW